MKKITLFIFTLVFTQFSFGQCDYTLEMDDSYGDGWSSTMDVLVDGVVELDDVGIGDGFGTTYNFPVTVGSDVTAVFTGVGNYQGEASYRILDAEGTLVAERLGGGADYGDPPPGDITTGTITGECPSCSTPTDVYVDNINTTSADIRWTAPGGSETAFEFKVVPYGDPEPLSGVSVSASVTAVQEADLMAGSIYDVYVRSVCGGDYSVWSTVVSFATECEVATGAFINDFEDVADITCWALFDGGPGTSSWTYSTLDGLWFLPYEDDFVSQHDDILFSPSFTVTDNLTDGFQYYVERPDSSWVNSYDILVYAADDLTSSGLLGTLVTGFSSDPDGATYAHDLSAYEGTDVRIAFHDYSAAANQDTYTIDDFRVASFASLGIEEASMAQFTYFPNPVNDVLTIKAQKTVEDVTVFNMLGQVVKRQTPYTMDCTVDLSAMQSGAYFVQVSINNTVETVRVLKK